MRHSTQLTRRVRNVVTQYSTTLWFYSLAVVVLTVAFSAGLVALGLALIASYLAVGILVYVLERQ